MQYTSVGVIVVISYIIGEFYKIIVKKDKTKYSYIPIIVGVSGGILGLITYIVSPELMSTIESPIVAVAVGIISGLASTGSNQILKQLFGKEDEI